MASWILLSIIVFQTRAGKIQAQEFGSFKPRIPWMQINTPQLRVIFPEGLEKQATRVANNILYINKNNRTSIGPLSEKLNLILNNQGILSNGYVTLMPFRSEFFTTPSQDGFSVGPGPWLDLLSVHEYRHALQYMNLKQGYTKYLWWLFGDAGWGSLMNITVPGWFFEGDAVANETALTKQGRGRMPSFFQESRSVLLSRRRYTYMKARNGSFRDIVPNEYELGYLLCSYGRENFVNDLWSKVVIQTARMHGIIYPFSSSVKSNTGLNTRQFYKKAISDYQARWKEDLSGLPVTPYRQVSQPVRTVTDYLFPVYRENGDLIVYKKSFKEPGAIYLVGADGTETRICRTGISQDPYFTASGNLISWAEVTWDERYSSQSYSDIVIYQADTGRKIYLTRKQRYFSPALSRDGKRIVVVEIDSFGKCLLKILDTQTGTLLSTLPNREDLLYTYPKWDTDGQSIISSARTSEGNMLIVKQLINGGAITRLTGEFIQVIGEVQVTEGSILFTSGLSGINNIYSLSRLNGKLSQLTGSEFGAYYPALDPGRKLLTYSDFHSRGYRLVSAPLDSLLWKEISQSVPNPLPGFEYKYFETEGGDIFGKVPSDSFGITPYRQAQHPVRVHSWSLAPTLFSAGINIFSDNVLNNVHFEGGFNYYYLESAPGFNAKIKYGGIYPILSAGISRYYRHTDIIDVLSTNEPVKPLSIDDTWSIGLELPLDFSKGEFFKLADIQLGYNHISVKNPWKHAGSDAPEYTVNAVGGQASFAISRKRALQNITTPLGMKLQINANRSIGHELSEQYQATADFAIRGLMPNHSLVLSAGLIHEVYANAYQYMDLFLYPRGFSIPSYDRMFTFQSSYHFPLFYPDIGFSGIFYCSRVRATLFADYGYTVILDSLGAGERGHLGSVGAELLFDTRWFNLTDLPLGVRFSLFLTADQAEPARKTKVEFVIPLIRL